MGTNFGILLSFNICTSLLENSGLITFEEAGCCSGCCNWRRRRFRLKRKVILHFVKNILFEKITGWLTIPYIYHTAEGFLLFLNTLLALNCFKEGDYYLLLHVDNIYFWTRLTEVEFGDGIENIIGLRRCCAVLGLNCQVWLRVNSTGCCGIESTKGSVSVVFRNLEEVLFFLSRSGITATNSCW
jgi:hypothetical protein